jgi:trehalose synthase
VNVLQCKAAVVLLQKAIREEFGLTVAEAMWKGVAVIGARTGGIAYQFEDGVNGFLADGVD